MLKNINKFGVCKTVLKELFMLHLFIDIDINIFQIFEHYLIVNSNILQEYFIIFQIVSAI